MDKPVTVPPFEAYRGADPCLFVSYSHRDSQLVYPELVRLRDLGYRIWYDEGIPPASEWPEEIARALERCEFFLMFVTPHAVQSRHVRNEITYAVDHGKGFLAVHLTRTELPAGLKLQMSNVQAVMAWQMPADAVQRKVAEALPERLLEADSRQRHLARLRQLAELQQQRRLWRDELLEVAAQYRALGNEAKADEATAAAARAAVRPEREQLACPQCGAPYANAYKVRCDACGAELPTPPSLAARAGERRPFGGLSEAILTSVYDNPVQLAIIVLVVCLVATAVAWLSVAPAASGLGPASVAPP